MPAHPARVAQLLVHHEQRLNRPTLDIRKVSRTYLEDFFYPVCHLTMIPPLSFQAISARDGRLRRFYSGLWTVTRGGVRSIPNLRTPWLLLPPPALSTKLASRRALRSRPRTRQSSRAESLRYL